jgi:hypothetical protein
VLWAAETRSTRGNGENPNVVADLLQMGEGGKVGLDIIFLDDKQESGLTKFCSAFFNSPTA